MIFHFKGFGETDYADRNNRDVDNDGYRSSGSRADVDQIHEVAQKIGAKIVHPPQEDGFAPGYYSVLFEDPDGIRLEANFIPGKGILEPGLDQIGHKDTKW